MTAEIVVMNKDAVALAADSAATLGENVETYNTQNKLFALSKHQPVGIMIYDRLYLNGVPWETIIKIYRSELGDKSFNTVKEYLEDFLKFLSGNRKLFPKKEQAMFIEGDIRSLLFDLQGQIYNELRSQGWEITDYSDVALQHTKNLIEKLRAEEDHSCFKSDFDTTLDDLLSFLDKSYISQIFAPFQLSDAVIKNIKAACRLLISKQVFLLGLTGVVVAGFGDEQHFPCTCSCNVGGFYNNQLKVSDIKIEEISHHNNAAIIPFAQEDMASAFLRGVHAQYEGFLLSRIIHDFFDLQVEVINDIDDLTLPQKEKWAKKFKKKPTNRLNALFQDLKEHIQTNYINPTLDGVMFLPKDELAAVAESLVNLATFKKSVSPGDNTVGGEIDVAVISKGDGLVWIKRKHYFEPEKNPNFFAKYYKS